MDMAAILVMVMWYKPFVLTFIPPSHGGCTWYLASIGLAVSKENKFKVSPQKLIGQLKWNFIWCLHGIAERKFVQTVQVTYGQDGRHAHI